MPIFQTQDNPASTHNHDSVYYTQSAADAAFSAAGHNHDSDYSAASHDHDSAYSATTHNHDSAYSATTHDHDADYLPINAALGDLSNVDETGKVDGQSVVWNAGASKYVLATVTSGGGVTDHGALTGLGDDDHTQYHNDTRGDARYSLLAHTHTGVYAASSHNHDATYYTETEVNNLLTGYSATSHNHDASYAAAAHTHDTRYYTETEMDVLLATKSATTHNHSGVYAAASHSHDGSYYTETEVNNLLSGKSNTTHLHDTGDIGTDLLGSGVAFTWGTGWTDFGGSAAPVKIKVIGNWCYLVGLPKRTSTSNANVTILTLDAAYRPADGNHYFYTYYVYGTSNNAQRVEVNSDGTVKIQASPSSAIEYVYIDGFCWPI